jgi:hypothetical protein
MLGALVDLSVFRRRRKLAVAQTHSLHAMILISFFMLS